MGRSTMSKYAACAYWACLMLLWTAATMEQGLRCHRGMPNLLYSFMSRLWRGASGSTQQPSYLSLSQDLIQLMLPGHRLPGSLLLSLVIPDVVIEMRTTGPYMYRLPRKVRFAPRSECFSNIEERRVCFLPRFQNRRATCRAPLT